MLTVKGGVTQGGPAAAAVGARPGWALPSLLGAISSLYPLPCTGLPFFLMPPHNQRQWGVPQARRYSHVFPACTSSNYCWVFSSLPWPRALCCCIGMECLEPALGTDLPTSHPTQLLQEQPGPWCWLHRREVLACSELTVPPATPHLL